MLGEVLEHLRVVAEAVGVPVNADFEGAYAVEPEQVGEHVRLAVATGIAGLSIEDSTGDEADPLFAFDLAVERVRAARRAIDESGTGRPAHRPDSEGFVWGRPDIDETVRRLRAFARRRRRLPLRTADRHRRADHRRRRAPWHPSR